MTRDGQATIANAWRDTGKALAAAMIRVGRTFMPQPPANPTRSSKSSEIEQAKTGQALAFLLTIVAMGAAIYFFAASNPIAGGALLSFPGIMLIRSFLAGLGRENAARRDDDEADTNDKGCSGAVFREEA